MSNVPSEIPERIEKSKFTRHIQLAGNFEWLFKIAYEQPRFGNALDKRLRNIQLSEQLIPKG